MKILTIRTDKPDAEIGLYDGVKQIAYETWQAHRQLGETIHNKLETLLRSGDVEWSGIEGIVCFKGPGSFTGLRIGLTVGNTLAYSYGVPIVAASDPEWITSGITRLLSGDSDTLALPFYGADAHITQQKK
jgi:tRNA threonylcarbamoyladenosine biosynthesis protein TsaB